MSKKESDDAVEIKRTTRGWILRATPTALIAVATGVLGMVGYGTMAPQRAAALIDDPVFSALRQEIKSHCDQQDKDWMAQHAKDHEQDGTASSTYAAVEMLNQGMVRTETKVDTIKEQMLAIQADMKELLRQRQLRNP